MKPNPCHSQNASIYLPNTSNDQKNAMQRLKQLTSRVASQENVTG
jgi:hypothetical protein